MTRSFLDLSMTQPIFILPIKYFCRYFGGYGEVTVVGRNAQIPSKILHTNVISKPTVLSNLGGDWLSKHNHVTGLTWLPIGYLPVAMGMGSVNRKLPVDAEFRGVQLGKHKNITDKITFTALQFFTETGYKKIIP